jgi:ABC-type glycerol-3-phosphate transport system substrate-binding protein
MRLTKNKWLWLTCLLLSIGLPLNAQESTPDVNTILHVWLPDELVLPEEPSMVEWFLAQSELFTQEQLIEIELRLRSTRVGGNILAILQTAATVAPDVMTLLRRSDLLIAQQSGLIQSIDSGLPSDLLDDIGANAQICTIGTSLYGVPLAIEVLHTVYLNTQPIIQWAYDDVLTRATPIAMPLGDGTGASEVALLQYFAGDGSLNAPLNPSTLRPILEFYETARNEQILDATLINITEPSEYFINLVTGDISQAVVTSSQFLRLQTLDEQYRPAPIPTLNGEAITSLDGWCWVLVTDDASEQATALRYITFMLQEARMRDMVDVLGVLPSRQTVMQSFPVQRPFYEQLLDNAIVLPNAEPIMSEELQNAIRSVLTGEQTVDEVLRNLEAP